ncbi:1,4-dihydroxy-2-naphthoate polyprenyltransferase [Marinitenerispora sediminis]|uniref:1,4-dihydroxy-2-naphthoate octaprenyltransferase n=1 Tax=Marinitenerispora sediminis TaxID=1931232 RepID=A0A368T6I6_9ACTN|nr:1,4-dihydroxy-2-naphthoate polyprenyltransferase [Marinitenerispora sediminis]RCV52181.1 1,4-dihydroxy-2-naphthoate polyprenyltransferase [Marinitenerispora sediminis]RCV53102.1 1,4-dihydroxy-2-naphthoate polyprenyltransferase [Marinitenerispora sediminis]RCV56223.1 1,4-dihydroxy-2-naphthoate polyprenyltransferase [Marinitenerispora sediminis]
MATVPEWVAGARPRTLPNSIVPVAIGTGVALGADAAVWWKAALAMVVALALQIGVNYANDYSDGVRGTDAERVGPTRLTATRLAAPRQVLVAAWACFAVAAVAGLVVALTSAWWLLLVGAAAIMAAWFYTGGKNPYGYHALGEVAVFVFFGLVAVVGTVFVQVGAAPWQGWAAAVAAGLLSCSVLVINNLRDIPTDSRTGKRTLAVVLGEAATRRLYIGCVAAAFAIAAAMAVANPWTLLALLAVPLALRPLRRVAGGQQGRDLVLGLGETGKMQLAFGVLFTVGLALG